MYLIDLVAISDAVKKYKSLLSSSFMFFQDIVLFVFIQGEVCGLCGNFDGDVQNDFTTQSQLVVTNPLEFANSWKVRSSCKDVDENVDPCDLEPKRQHWSKMMCSIITGTTFQHCHTKV